MDVQEAFQRCHLDILVLEELPPLPEVLSKDTMQWLELVLESKSRTNVFYDEMLEFFLTIRFPSVEPESPHHLQCPPAEILSIILASEVAVEASYISSTPFLPQDQGEQSRTSEKGTNQLPPSMSRPKTVSPNTPFPVPSTSADDASYAYSSGKPFQSYVLGNHSQRKHSGGREFTLLWDEKHSSWLAIYYLSLRVMYDSAQPLQPLLCMTVSITLRDHQRSPPFVLDSLSRFQKLSAMHNVSMHSDRNLLKGLESLYRDKDQYAISLRFPNSRLSHNLEAGRRIVRGSRSAARPVMRKSYRKTLRPLSACHLRMFTALVPTMSVNDDDVESCDSMPIGSEERTIVLCLEIDTDGSDGHGFCVRSVDVRVQGEGCTSKFISWEDDAESAFPLHITPRSQFSLLYGIFFKDQLPHDDILHAARNFPSQVLPANKHRAISIEIKGQPFIDSQEQRTYLASVFATRWNCALDLNSAVIGGPKRHHGQSRHSTVSNEAVPIPPSPFPATSHHLLIANKKMNGGNSSSADKRFSKDKPLPPLNHRISTLISDKGMNKVEQSRSFTPEKIVIRRPQSLQSTSSQPRNIWSSSLSSNASHNEPESALAPKLPYTEIDFLTTNTSVDHSSKVAPAEMVISPGHTLVENPIIVSVQLVSEEGSNYPEIIPGNRFCLDVFIFNKSPWTRSFAIGFDTHTKTGMQLIKAPLTPLENNVRTGPLNPETCQTLRIQMMALEPGVHTINNLTITDLSSNYKITLRSVVDIVVQNPGI